MRMKRAINRLPSRLPVEAVKTYQVKAPPGSHWRPVPCGDPALDPPCTAHAVGWLTRLNPAVDGALLNWIRLQSGRSYVEVRDVADLATAGLLFETPDPIPPGFVALWFKAGQQCFAEHRVPLEREPILVVRGGDWRGNPRREKRIHVRRDDWVEDFALHQQTLADRFNQG